MNKIITLIFVFFSLQASNPQPASSFGLLNADIKTLIATSIINTYPSTPSGIFRAGRIFTFLSMTNKESNIEFNSPVPTQAFLNACKEKSISRYLACTLVKTKGTLNFLDKKKNFLLNLNINCEKKLNELIELINASKKSKEIALLLQIQSIKDASNVLNLLHLETLPLRRALDIHYAQKAGLSESSFFEKGNHLKLDKHTSLHYFNSEKSGLIIMRILKKTDSNDIQVKIIPNHISSLLTKSNTGELYLTSILAQDVDTASLEFSQIDFDLLPNHKLIGKKYVHSSSRLMSQLICDNYYLINISSNLFALLFKIPLKSPHATPQAINPPIAFLKKADADDLLIINEQGEPVAGNLIKMNILSLR